MIHIKHNFYILLLLIIPISVQAQSLSQKDKYWIYRERLKNFMVRSGGTDCSSSNPADCLGRNIIANGRDKQGTNNDLHRTIPPNIGWADTPWFIGYWMGTLAMEYQMLTKSGLSPTSTEVMQTKEDLYGAIESVNRLDWEAEESWGCSPCGSSYSVCRENINGFLIADDIPNDFSQVQTIIDGLNDGLVPPPDGYRDKCISSAFTECFTPGREASQDHLVGLYIGLALVKQCLHTVPEENWNNTPFINGLSEPNNASFVTEVQIISSRIINYLNSNSWLYINKCTGGCVKGVDNPNNTSSCKPQGTGGKSCTDNGYPNCCTDGGAIAIPQAIGFAAANQFIQKGGVYESSAATTLTLLLLNPTLAYITAWDAALVSGDRLPLTLAALGNIWEVGTCIQDVETTITFDFCAGFPGCWTPSWWGCCKSKTVTIPIPVPCISTTADVSDHMVDVGESYHWEHLYLLHKLLWGGGAKEIGSSYYECLLNAAPCRGYDGTNDNVEWGWTDRLSGDRNLEDPNNTNSSSNSRVDYMFYYNLYNLADNISADFSPIPIKQLALSDIVKSGYKEYDEKNFMAANTITANSYTIKSDPTEGQGRVTFSAGKSITLNNGFSVTNGGYFHGYIDPTIGAMSCTDPPSTTNCSGEERSMIEPDTITDADSVIAMSIPNILATSLPLPCPVDTLHPQAKYFDSTATSFYWDFGNGQTSTLEAPSIYYSTPGIYSLTLITFSPTSTDTISMHIIVPNCSNNLAKVAPTPPNTEVTNISSLQPYVYHVSVYPNPNNGYMYVSYSIPANESGIFGLYDVLGNLLLSYPISGGTKTFTVDGSALAKGVYFFQVYSNNKLVAKDKIVVIK